MVGRVPGSRLFSPSLPPSLVLSPALTQQNPPTSSATSGTAGYIIAAIIVSQVITAREHPPRCSPGEGGGAGSTGMSREREGMREREGGGNGAEKEERELKIDLRDWGQKRHGRRKMEKGWRCGCLSFRFHTNTNLKTWCHEMHLYRDCGASSGVETGEPHFSAGPQGGGVEKQPSRPIVLPPACGNVCDSLLDPSEGGGSQKPKLEKTKQWCFLYTQKKLIIGEILGRGNVQMPPNTSRNNTSGPDFTRRIFFFFLFSFKIWPFHSVTGIGRNKMAHYFYTPHLCLKCDFCAHNEADISSVVCALHMQVTTFLF